MSVLYSLARAYERIPDAPPIGFSEQNIGILITLSSDGSVKWIDDWREPVKKKLISRKVAVPNPIKRAVNILPNFLWDKTSYALGLTVGERKRTAEEHAAFVKAHEDWLTGTEDEGLQAFFKFLQNWSPESGMPEGWKEELLDLNVIFMLESDKKDNLFLHDRPAARALWLQISGGGGDEALCLVNGAKGPIVRLHPSIKGVFGGQPSGTSLVSFNQKAFTSYGFEQGYNAPVSVYAATAYTSALNIFLGYKSGHNFRIADTTIVFWAEASDAAVARAAEEVFVALFNAEDIAEESAVTPKQAMARHEEKNATKKIQSITYSMQQGLPLDRDDLEIAEDIKFYILGLVPNVARLSVRFDYEGTFDHFVKNHQRFMEEMRIEPAGRIPHPSFWRYLSEIATLGKAENIPPQLAGDWMRSVIAGTRYPETLLTGTLLRIRADGEVSAMRASILKALLIRNKNMKKEVTVALNQETRDKGYLLGRLFAVYEWIQSAALGKNVNATVKDKYYGSASMQPQKVFGFLARNSVNHLARIRKEKPGYNIILDKTITEIIELLDPNNQPFPPSLSAKEQAIFSLGYYHQRSEFFKKQSEKSDIQEKK